MKKYSKRQFLNVPEKCTTAHINLRIDETGFMAIKITDCTRQIELHSRLSNLQSAQNAKYKLDTFIEVLEATKQHIEENFEYESVLKVNFKTLDEARKYINEAWRLDELSSEDFEVNKTKTVYKNKILNRKMRIKTKTETIKGEKVKKYLVAISLPFSQI